METILEKIVNNRRKKIAEEQSSFGMRDAMESALEKRHSGKHPVHFFSFDDKTPFLIAEIKKASPSKGLIRKDFDVARIAEIYGSSRYVKAISVLTEPDFFHGGYINLEIAGGLAKKPLLMKDFVFDEYQIYRGYISGASAVLFIASVLNDREVDKLRRTADSLGMEILFEVHSEDEYKRAIDLGMKTIGINNRDLKTFITDIENTVRIVEKIGKPGSVRIISESGISSRSDIDMLFSAGSDGFLIGEYFMKNDDIALAVEKLMKGHL